MIDLFICSKLAIGEYSSFEWTIMLTDIVKSVSFDKYLFSNITSAPLAQFLF